MELLKNTAHNCAVKFLLCQIAVEVLSDRALFMLIKEVNEVRIQVAQAPE